MAQRGGRNTSFEQRPVILALECPRLEESSLGLRPSQPRARVCTSPVASVASLFGPCIFTIHIGEDIGEMIRVFFEEHKHNIQSSYEGRILTISGDVTSPRIVVQGSSTIFKGTYSIAILLGRYIICNDGPVQQDQLKISFQSYDSVVGGSVVGPLIAGCEVQVIFSLLVILVILRYLFKH
ncbi:hypothetical protein DH2020_019081 [Rehmannia glutinosa]|uniref:AT-hook motif nuclear-localized protein n=1 Tax=Rehmannia glutinosa TaxID=99300 RepID=A0ABR0WP88_REHGL